MAAKKRERKWILFIFVVAISLFALLFIPEVMELSTQEGGFSSFFALSFNNEFFTTAAIGILNSGSGSQCGGINATTLLTQNVNSTGTCFTINSSNIVLDCRGFEINYSSDGIIGYGVLNDGFDNVTIRNCIIHEGTITGDRKHGIQLSAGAANTTIFNNTLKMLGVESHGIYALQYSNYTNISQNTINITGGSIAILLFDSSYNNIFFNSIITTGTTGTVRGISVVNADFNNLIFANNITITSIGHGLRMYIENGTLAPHNNIFYNNTVFGVSDLSFLDEGVVTNNNTLIYDGTFGSINWTQGNLTTNLSLIVGTTIFIQNNTIGVVDSPHLLRLNQSSRTTITFKSQGYATTPYLFKSGVRCDHNGVCNITYNSATATLTANVSSFSNYTTQANLVPNVTNAVPTLNSIFNTSQTIEIGVNVTDDGGIVSTVFANITYPNSSLFQYTLSNSTGHPQRYNMTFIIPRLNGVYNITFMANDSANVMNSTERSNFTALLTCGELRHTSSMSQNLTSTGTCFTINASNIVLNCAGYQINYSSAGISGNGVTNGGSSAGFSNVTVQNCVILEGTSTTNSKTGINYFTAENGTIYNNTITITGTFSNAISLNNANRTNVSANTVFVRSDASAIMIAPSHFHSIYFNRIHVSAVGGFATTGISLAQPSFSNYVLANNITLEDVGTAISLQMAGSANNIFANNTVYTRSGTTIIDYNTVTNNTLIYEGTFGSINWTSTNLTTNLSLIVGTTIFLENNTLGVLDSARMGRLNTSAKIIMRGLTYSSTPQLLKAGTQCDGTIFCNLSYDTSTGVLTANITSFSNYTTQGVAAGSRLISVDIINTSVGSSSQGGGFVVSSTSGKITNGTSLTYAAFDPTGLSRLNLSSIININISLIANSSHGNYVNVTFGWMLAKSNGSTMLNRTVYNNTLNQTSFNYSFNTNLLPDGIYNISVYVQNVSTDAAFSPNIVVNYSRGFDIAIDRTPPNVTSLTLNNFSDFVSLSPGLSADFISLNVTVNDSTTTVLSVFFEINSTNGSRFNISASRYAGRWNATINLSLLTESVHSARVYANDTLANINNSQYITFLVNRTVQTDAGSGAGNGGGSGGGGGGGGGGGSSGGSSIEAPIITPECMSNTDCALTEYCSDNVCLPYECTSNADCRDNLYCVEHECARVFDLKIINLEIADDELLFTYGMKNMVKDAGDVVLDFWVEAADGTVISSGSDIIFVGHEDVIEQGKLFFAPQAPGAYTLFITLTFNEYTITIHRTFAVSQEEVVAAESAVAKKLPSNLFGSAIGVLPPFIKQWWLLGLALLAVISLGGVMAIKMKPKKTQVQLLEAWVQHALSSGHEMEEIHMLLVKHGFSELTIHLAVDRVRARRELQQRYNLSIDTVQNIQKLILKSRQRGIPQDKVISDLAAQEWGNDAVERFDVIERFVRAYYIG